MYFTTFDPFARDFQRQLDRLARRAPGTSAAMPLDIVRHDGDVTLRFDVPGIDLEQVEVTVDRGILSVSGSGRRSGPRTTSSSCGSARWVRSPAACGCRRT